MKKKKISIVIPTYNEEMNVVPLVDEIKKVFKKSLKKYNYEIIFIDNYSTDTTREKIKQICKKDKNIKAIFNAKNFGPFNSPFYGLLQTTGDCSILMCADFQDPPELIPEFVKEWEKGYKIVIGKKTKSKENKIMYFLRTLYYKFIKAFSTIEQIEHFTGFGLYDKKFIDILKRLDDPIPFIRSIVAELGFKRKEIEYIQPKRRAGKTKTNLYNLYDSAMIGITSYTKIILRSAVFIGGLMVVFSFLYGCLYFITNMILKKQIFIEINFIELIILFILSLNLFFIGMLGEYILNINLRIMKRPLVIEEKRINF